MSEAPRLAPAFSEARSDRYRIIRELGRVEMDFFGCSMGQLVDVLGQPDANKIVTAKCNHCPTTLQCRAIVAPMVACAACIQAHAQADKEKMYREYWQKVCPEDFRDTSLTHEGFPADIVAALKKKDPARSLFFYGPTGTAKTRVAMLMLYEALLRGQRVGVLWPEKLAGLKSDFDDRGSFERYAAYDVLLMDDALLTAVRASKLIDALKQLIDVRMRHRRPFIITSQIGSEADLKEGKEFGDAKAADIERIKAMLRRLNETCDVVPFARKEGAF
jgi:hypothetical protein